MKVFEREMWVDYKYNPQLPMPEGLDKYDIVMHALIGDCVFWSTRADPGYSKKIRVTVEILEEHP